MVKKRASGGCSADKAQQRLRGIQPLCSLQGAFCALLPGAALNAPCPGYRFTAVCRPVAPWFTAFCGSVARTDAQHRLRELCHPARCSRGRRLTRLARATGSPPSAGRSPHGSPPSAGLVARVRRQPQPGFSPALTCCASRPANAPAAGQSPDRQNAPAVISPPRLPRSPR